MRSMGRLSARSIGSYLGALGLASSLIAAAPRLEVKADKSAAKLGEEIRLVVSASLAPGEEAELLPPRSEDFLVRVAEPLEPKGGEISYELYLRPLSLGEVEVPPLAVEIRRGEERRILSSEGFKLRVEGRLDAAAGGSVADIIPPSRQPYPAGLWLWPLVAACVVLAFAYFWRRRGFREEGMHAAPIEGPGERARRELAELGELRADGEEALRRYYERLSAVMRDYLSRRFDIPALVSTTSEIRRGLAGEEQVAQVRRSLDRLLAGSDLVKFARRQTGPLEAKADLELALQVVDLTSPVSEEPGKKAVSE